MNKRCRILIVSSIYPFPFDPANGIFVKRQIEEVANKGFEVRVIRPVYYIPKRLGNYLKNEKWKIFAQLPKEEYVGSIVVYYVRYIELPFTWFYPFTGYTLFLSLCKRMKSILKDFKPDIIHSYNATPVGFAALLVSRRYNLKHICGLRGSDINLYPFMNKLTYKMTEKVLKESNQILSVSYELKRKALTIAQTKKEIKVIYNGCDFSTFSSRKGFSVDVRKNLGISEKSKCLIYVGYLKVNKGIYDLIEIFRRIAINDSQIYLIIIGYGEEQNFLNKKILDFFLQERIFLLGSRNQEEINNFLCASNIFIFPTLSEGLPNAILEAMACRLPVVASRVGGIPEIVKDGITGYLVDAGNIDGFVKAVNKLLYNEALCEKMGIEGLKIVQRDFTWEKSAEELSNIYEQLHTQ